MGRAGPSDTSRQRRGGLAWEGLHQLYMKAETKWVLAWAGLHHLHFNAKKRRADMGRAAPFISHDEEAVGWRREGCTTRSITTVSIRG